jgi:site-specific DNA recombinase
MSVPSHDRPLAPRRGRDLRVLVVARISTTHQDPRSLDDQAALCERHVRDRYDGPVRFERVSGQGSGEVIDRADFLRAVELVESGAFDLVITEDLGRICRRTQGTVFCEACEDAGTRLVAINDHIDTARGDWRMHAFFATMKHEMANQDTSQRIKRSLGNRFDQGGVVQTLVYGYVKPPGATSDSQVTKDPAAGPVYDEVFRRLEEGATYAEVADWLNASGIPTGEWARGKRWDGRMLGRVVRNPILKGLRVRNARKSVRVNRTGRRKSVKADPSERRERYCPHLAFIEPARYDRVIAKLAAHNGHYARGRAAKAADRRAGVPKKRTAWPGQHARCGVCGRLYYWGGHGRAGHLMCSGARDYACWVAATFDGAEGARRVAAALLAAVELLPEFDAAFRAEAEAAALARGVARRDELARLDAALAEADRGIENLLDNLADVGRSEAISRRLVEAEARLADLVAGRADLASQPDEVPELPPIDELKARARRLLAAADFSDPAFGRTLSALVPRVELFPVQLLDGGAVGLRARLTLHLAGLAEGSHPGRTGLLTRTAWVDLFDPPQRVVYRKRVAALRAAGRTERETAAELGITQPAVQAAMRLHRRMANEGLGDPYVFLSAPTDGGRANARHRHDRYDFKPQPGYPADPAA